MITDEMVEKAAASYEQAYSDKFADHQIAIRAALEAVAPMIAKEEAKEIFRVVEKWEPERRYYATKADWIMHSDIVCTVKELVEQAILARHKG